MGSGRNGAEAVKVFARLRPVQQNEVAAAAAGNDAGANAMALRCEGTATVIVQPGGQKFAFDRVFDTHASQADVYDLAVKPIVESALTGFNGAVIAYGQTGSGKTYSMLGKGKDEQGVIPRAVAALFRYIQLADSELRFTIEVSFLEIYNEQLRDLLAPPAGLLKKLSIVTNAKGMVEVKGLTYESLFDESRYFELYNRASKMRTTSATEMNEVSSRSHFIAALRLSTTLPDESERTGVLYLVDLAGSERIAKTKAEGTTLEEAKKINGSLHVLGNVINALTSTGSSHVPYRDSVLTRVLRDALGGNSRTCLLLTLSPLADNCSESISTLRFGQRAKMIKNRVAANIVRSAAQLEREMAQLVRTNADLQAYVQELQKLLKSNNIEFPAKPGLTSPSPGVASQESLRQTTAAVKDTDHETLTNLEEKLTAAETALAERSTEVSQLRTLLSLKDAEIVPSAAVEPTNRQQHAVASERTTTAGSGEWAGGFAEETSSSHSSAAEHELDPGVLDDSEIDVEDLTGLLLEMQKLKKLWDYGNERLQKKRQQVNELKAKNSRLAHDLYLSKIHAEGVAAKYNKLIEHTFQALPPLDYAHLARSDTPKQPRFTKMLRGGGGGGGSGQRNSVGEQALLKWGRALLHKSRTLLGGPGGPHKHPPSEPGDTASHSNSEAKD